MTGTNQILQFCATDTGTNLETQANYLSDSVRPIGNQPGVASSKFNNKALRQATFVAAALAQLAVNTTGEDVLDDGNITNLINTLSDCIIQLAQMNFIAKEPVLSATTPAIGNITLSGVQTIDGVSGSVGQRVLVKNQTDTTTNGIYLQASGAWSRSSDFDTAVEIIPGCLIPIIQGTVNADTAFQLTTTGTIIVGTTGLNFSILSGGGITSTGPSTDNALVRYNGISGSSVQNSGVIIDDSNNMLVPGTLNAATLEQSGNKVNGVLLLSQSIVSQASFVINNTYINSNFTRYELKFTAENTNTAGLYLTLSNNNGSTYFTTGYSWAGSEINSSSGTSTSHGASSDSKLDLMSTTTMTAVTGNIILGSIEFGNPNSTPDKCMFDWRLAGWDAGNMAKYSGGGCYNTVGAINALKVAMSSGNITGTFELYGFNQ